MLISVSRDVAIPLVNQIHDQVVAAISTGDLKAGDRLPTIRELAQFLGINRNTVAQAYRLLESSGHVHTRAGAGTRVADTGPVTGKARMHELRGLVADGLKQAVDRGFSAQDFGQLAYYEGIRWACLSRVAVLVVHDYPHELESLRQSVTSHFSAVDARGVLLQDLDRLVAGGGLDTLAGVDLALAPVQFLEHVTELLAEAPFPVLGAGIGPSLATLVQVAKETAGERKRVALVSTDPAGAASMDEVLSSAGVALAETRHATVKEPELRQVVDWADLVLVSDGAADAVASLGADRPVIRFGTLISDASLATVRSYIDHVIRVKCREPRA